MGIANHEAIKQFHSLMDQSQLPKPMDEQLKDTFQNMHQGYPNETLVRFLKAREWNVTKAHKMLADCLEWRIQNEIDNILARPIIPSDLYRAIRDSQLLGLSGYSREGLPVVAIGVGLSTFDKASVHYYVQSHIQMNEYRDRVILPLATQMYGRHISTCLKVLDMTGLKLSALNQIKLLTTISAVDDLNYPEKAETYYIVNAPYIFSACWKVVKPLLQERTRRKIQVLQGCGRDELLKLLSINIPDKSESLVQDVIAIHLSHVNKIMDYSSLPHFCKKEGSGSSRRVGNGTNQNCFSLDHDFHQQLYNYIKQQAMLGESISPIKQGSVHVDIPEPNPEDAKIAKTIESEFHKFGDLNGLCHSMNGVKVNGH